MFPKDVQKLVELAAIWAEDGAPLTAADRLQEAVDRLREIGQARAAFVEELISTGAAREATIVLRGE